MKGYLFDSRRGLPGSVVYDNPYAAERLYDRNYFGQLRYENRFSEKWKLKASGKFNYSWNKDTDKKAAGPTEDRFSQTETYLTATLWAMPVKNLSFRWRRILSIMIWPRHWRSANTRNVIPA